MDNIVTEAIFESITVDACLAAVKELNKDIPQSEAQLKHKANFLYLLNKLSFWDDLPVLMEFVEYEAERAVEKYCAEKK